MESNSLAAVVSALVSIVLAVFYWICSCFYQNYSNKKTIKIFKNYAIEFLKSCITGYNESKLCLGDKIYQLDQLKIVLELNPQKLQYNIFVKPKEDLILIYALRFLAKKYQLEHNELWLLRNILDNMSPDEVWFFRDNTLMQAMGYNTSFESFSVQDKNNNNLFFFINDCNIVLTKNTDKNKLETLLTKLTHHEFDKRIEKAFKQWQTKNKPLNL